jgi:hypothetical protein
VTGRLGRPSLHRSARVAAAAIVGLAFLLLASSTTATESVLSRLPEYAPVLRLLPRYEGQSGDPQLPRGIQIDVGSIRRAAAHVSDDALYYLQAPEPIAEDVRRVARLYFLPSVEVRRATDADWILVFRSRSPPGVEHSEPVVLSRDVSLIRVAS